MIGREGGGQCVGVGFDRTCRARVPRDDVFFENNRFRPVRPDRSSGTVGIIIALCTRTYYAQYIL